jgi:hypothetical protein
MAAPRSDAGVLARTSIFDRTLVCRTLIQGGLPFFGFAGRAESQSAPAGLSVRTADQTSLLGFDWAHRGISINNEMCSTAKSPLALSPAGLARAGVWPAGGTGFSQSCLLPGKVLVRLRAVLDGDNHVASAQLVIRMQRGAKRIGFLRFTPKKVSVWATPKCE